MAETLPKYRPLRVNRVAISIRKWSRMTIDFAGSRHPRTNFRELNRSWIAHTGTKRFLSQCKRPRLNNSFSNVHVYKNSPKNKPSTQWKKWSLTPMLLPPVVTMTAILYAENSNGSSTSWNKDKISRISLIMRNLYRILCWRKHMRMRIKRWEISFYASKTKSTTLPISKNKVSISTNVKVLTSFWSKTRGDLRISKWLSKIWKVHSSAVCYKTWKKRINVMGYGQSGSKDLEITWTCLD